MFKETRKFNLMTIGSQEPIVMTLFATELEKKLCKRFFKMSNIARPNAWCNSYEMTMYTFCRIFVYKYNVTWNMPEAK